MLLEDGKKALGKVFPFKVVRLVEISFEKYHGKVIGYRSD